MAGLLHLKWNNHNFAFSKKLSSLRDKSLYCDCTLICEGNYYPVHKFVLSTCSEYFEEILEKTVGSLCRHPYIILKDVSSIFLENLLNFMYSGDVSVPQDNLSLLLEAAEALKVRGLAIPEVNEEEQNENVLLKIGRKRRLSQADGTLPLKRVNKIHSYQNSSNSMKSASRSSGEVESSPESLAIPIYQTEDTRINSQKNTAHNDSLKPVTESRESCTNEKSKEIKEEPMDEHQLDIKEYSIDAKGEVTGSSIDNLYFNTDSQQLNHRVSANNLPQCSSWEDQQNNGCLSIPSSPFTKAKASLLSAIYRGKMERQTARSHKLQERCGNNRKQCKMCYARLKSEYNREVARKRVKKVLTYCSDCIGNPTLCVECFYDVHTC